MCGIVGIKSWRAPPTTERLVSMRDTMVHRGPNDAGVWVESSAMVGMAHRRLSIIDPRPVGRQPFFTKDQQYGIVFNGEIYNYIELRQSLQERGLCFTTDTDTEVLLAAYRVFGESCVEHFNGMFAFAIWDALKGTLFLARDRLGVKPLYYAWSRNGDFMFASETKAILVGEHAPRLRLTRVEDYMTYGYLPGAETLYEGIKRLPPGHTAVVKDGKVRVEEYWDVSFKEIDANRSESEWLESIEALLSDSIRLRMRSDVPVGVFLSGGLDSSAVVSLLSEQLDQQIKTYSVGYDLGQEFDETPHARRVARRFGTEHHEVFVQPDEFVDFIPRFVELLDEPVTEAAAISLFYVSKLAAESVTVVLSGEGADEIFGGYDFYRYNLVVERLRRRLGPVPSSTMAALLTRVPNAKIRKYARMLETGLTGRYRGISTYDPEIRRSIYSRGFKAHLLERENPDAFAEMLFARVQDADPLAKMLYFDTKSWLVDDLLIKADRMSMACSLELRVPFLDYRLVEHAARMPPSMKIRGRQGKYLLKRMMSRRLPSKTIHRRKLGFPTPLSIMLRGRLGEYAWDLFSNPNAKARCLFNFNEIQGLLRQHQKGRHDHHKAIWQAIVLTQWLEQSPASL